MRTAAGFGRRIGSSLYELVVVAALLIAVGFALLPVVTPSASGPPSRLYALSPVGRLFTGAVMLAVCAAYFGWLWSRGRRTLAMKTWRLALVRADGLPLGVERALLRFVACLSGLALSIAAFAWLDPLGHGRWAAAALGLNYVWALVDAEGRFLQDRVAGTRLVFSP